MDLILELRKMGPASARSISRQELNEPPQRRPAQQVKHQPKRPQMASLEVSDFMRSQYEEELRQYELGLLCTRVGRAAQSAQKGGHRKPYPKLHSLSSHPRARTAVLRGVRAPL